MATNDCTTIDYLRRTTFSYCDDSECHTITITYVRDTVNEAIQTILYFLDKYKSRSGWTLQTKPLKPIQLPKRHDIVVRNRLYNKRIIRQSFEKEINI